MPIRKNMAKKIIGVACGIIFLCAGNTLAETIRIAGSSTVRPIVTKASVVFGKEHNVNFDIQGGGSSHGVKSVATGQVDIGDASRFLKDKEKSKWPSLVPHLVGQDGVAIIVNAKLGVKNLTKKQVQAIYLGHVQNWQEVGGPDEEIVLVSKEHGRSTLDLFLEYTGLEAKENKGTLHMTHRVKGDNGPFSSVQARIIGSNQAAIIQVARQVGAIGYVSVGDALLFAEKTGKISLPKLDGIAASHETVKKGTFPITRPLHVVTNGQPRGTVKEFIDYLLSPDGQKHVVASNFIPVR